MSEIPNAEVAERLTEVAELLAEQGANLYRVPVTPALHQKANPGGLRLLTRGSNFDAKLCLGEAMPRSCFWTRALLAYLCLTLAPFVGCAPIEASPELRDAARDLHGRLAVFPGAEGYGTTTPAGRRGAVIRVTSLAASGPGTLREALSAQGPRTVIFEIGGVIRTPEPLLIAEPYITIAGQTAPSPGITLTGSSIVIATHDVLIQHLRVRAGDSPEGPDPGGRDSISIVGAADGGLAVHDVVIDHCSFSWAIDEGASTWNPGVHDISILRSVIAENLSHSLHPKGEHSKGLLIGDHSKRVAVIGNLFAHNRLRNPFFKGDVSAVVTNNLIYNPGAEALHLDDPDRSGPTLLTVAGNVLVPGPDTNAAVPLVDALAFVQPTSEVCMLANDSGGRFPYRALLAPGIFRRADDLAGCSARFAPLTLLSAEQARAAVVAGAGARPLDRDAIDARIFADVGKGTGRIIDSPAEVGGLPETTPVLRTLTLPADPDGDADGDGYTDLEEWLHTLAAELEPRALAQ